MKRLGSAVFVAGGVLVIVSNFLHFFASGSFSLWQVTTRYPAVVTAVAGLAIVLVAISLAGEHVLLLGVAAVLGAFLLGEAFPIPLPSYNFYGVGFWTAVAGAALMAVGGLVALGGAIRAAAAPGFGFMPAAGAQPQAAMAAKATPSAIIAPAAVAAPVGAAPEPPPATTSTWAGRIATPRAETAPAATGLLPPAGWYPDPAGTAHERYWSGDQWTHDVRGD